MSEAKILATVAGKNITETDVEAFILNLPREQQAYASNPQFREQVLEQLIALQLLAEEGEELKLDETPEFKSALAAAKRDILAQMQIMKLMNSVSVSEEDAQAYFEANKSLFAKGDQVGAKHILVDCEEQCSNILADIKSGAVTFEDAAMANSTCPSKERGGDLGTFGRGQMVPEFEQAAWAAEVDDVVGPVKTQFGYHLIKVYSKVKADEVKYEDVKNQVIGQLLQQKKEATYAAKVADLKARYM